LWRAQASVSLSKDPAKAGPGRTAMEDTQRKPHQNWVRLALISFGFLGIQIGFELQNNNMSRIFQTLGAPIDDLPWLWAAAPLTGLLVQPIIGHMSDRTWLGRFGRRRPYFLAGALLASLSLFAMPLAPVLLTAAGLLWLLDASLNISMEPFRAFVGDMLDKRQHNIGYAMQALFIGLGSVIAAVFPWLLAYFDVANVAPKGEIPDTVKYSFWFGSVALFAAVLVTVVSTREYSPEDMRFFSDQTEELANHGIASPVRHLAARSFGSCIAWIIAGLLVIGVVEIFGAEKEMYLLGALLSAYGLASMLAIYLARSGNETNMLTHIVGDFSRMPEIMKKLALVQFFSWSALFIMWTYTTAVVSQYIFGSTDPTTTAFQDGGNWVGIMSLVRNGIAAVAAIMILPWLGRRYGNARTHMACLAIGSLGFFSFLFIRDQQVILLAQIGIGIAWASILSMPYAILASNLPQAKLGIFMGLFNVFIVVPQLLVATVMGTIMKNFFSTEPIWTMAFAGAVWAIAALAMSRLIADGENVQVPQ
jgi:maltose/moltooligosaccharide transporter